MSFYGISPVLFNSVSMTTLTLGANDPEIGTKVQYQGGEYVFVYNDSLSQISRHLGATVTGVSGYSVTVSSTTLVDILVGVCQHATIPTAGYGWLLTKGWGIVAMGADNSAAVGAQLALGTDGGFGRRGSSNTDVVLGDCVGKIMSAVASGGSCGAWIKAFM